MNLDQIDHVKVLRRSGWAALILAAAFGANMCAAGFAFATGATWMGVVLLPLGAFCGFLAIVLLHVFLSDLYCLWSKE